MCDDQFWKKEFSLLWIGQIFSLFSSAIIQFALIWWLTERTGSAVVLAFATLAAFVPDIFIGPLVGPLIDRCNRKAVLLFSLIGSIGISALMVFFFLWNWVIPVLILAVIFLRAILNAFRLPALVAAATQIVPENELTRINALDFVIRGMSGVVGPILGAVLIRALPMTTVFCVEIGALFCALIPLFFLYLPSVRRNMDEKVSFRAHWGRTWEELGNGFRYVQRTPGLFRFLLYVSVTNMLLMPAESLLPLMVSEHFRGAALHMSTIGAAFGIGSIVGGLMLSLWGGFPSRMKTSISGDLLFGFGVFLIGIARHDQFILAVFGWCLAGIGESFSIANMNALIQSRTRPEMQGRVFSISTSLINLSIPVAMLMTGPIAQLLGVQFWYVFSGIGILVLSGSMMFIPAMFRFERVKPVRRLEQSYRQI